MNREVHHDFTLKWALEEGFTLAEAQAIADANWACDRIHADLAGKRFHWPLLGAWFVARGRFDDAVRMRDLVALGESLHATQDAIGHGFWGHFHHWHGIDRWAQRGPRVRRRIETRSRQVLAEYRRITGRPSEGAPAHPGAQNVSPGPAQG